MKIILDNLFRKGEKINIEELGKFNLFRNKILHGDERYMGYGTTPNLIRLFLYLDFLIKIFDKITLFEINRTSEIDF
jgi:hypothetical protein